MAAASVKSIPVKQLVVEVSPRLKLDPLMAMLKQRLGRLGCSACLSGLNRLVIVDKIGRNIR